MHRSFAKPEELLRSMTTPTRLSCCVTRVLPSKASLNCHVLGGYTYINYAGKGKDDYSIACNRRLKEVANIGEFTQIPLALRTDNTSKRLLLLSM